MVTRKDRHRRTIQLANVQRCPLFYRGLLPSLTNASAGEEQKLKG